MKDIEDYFRKHKNKDDVISTREINIYEELKDLENQIPRINEESRKIEYMSNKVMYSNKKYIQEYDS